MIIREGQWPGVSDSRWFRKFDTHCTIRPLNQSGSVDDGCIRFNCCCTLEFLLMHACAIVCVEKAYRDDIISVSGLSSHTLVMQM